MANISELLVEIYTLRSRSAMNQKYYGVKLHRTQRNSTIVDFLIALGTTGSGISAFTILKSTSYGAIVLTVLSFISAVLALAKPILQTNRTIERLTRLYAGHAENYANLDALVSRIKRENILPDEAEKALEAAEARYTELSKDDDPLPNAKLQRKCEDEVSQLHPPADAWFPPRAEPSSARGPGNPDA